MRELVGEIRANLGRALTFEFRLDAVCFQRNLLKLLARLGCSYADEVSFVQWIGLRAAGAAQLRWAAVDRRGLDVLLWAVSQSAKTSDNGRRPA